MAREWTVKPQRDAAGRARALIISIAFFGAAAPAFAADAEPLQLTCLTEHPVIVKGQRAALKALVTTPDGRRIEPSAQFEWTVPLGRVEQRSSAVTRWDLSSAPANAASEPDPYKATVSVTVQGNKPASCEVNVFVGGDPPPGLDRGTLRGDGLLAARRLLSPGDQEESIYGLYSYLLIRSEPPADSVERARYLKTMEAALLAIQDISAYLAFRVPPRDLNALYIPVKQPLERLKGPNAQFAASVLGAYDYARANVLLREAKRSEVRGGPYLLAVLKPLGGAAKKSDAHLWLDLTGVVPDQVRSWVEHFVWLSAQQRGWTEKTLESLTLNLRKWLAASTQAVMPQGQGSAPIQFRPSS